MLSRGDLRCHIIVRSFWTNTANWGAWSTFTALTTRPQPSGLGGWRTVTRFSSGGWSPSSNLAINGNDPSGGGAPALQCTERSIGTCAFASRTAPLTIRMRFDCEPLAGSRFQGALASRAAQIQPLRRSKRPMGPAQAIESGSVEQ